jgi:hypothetical protein
MSTVVIAGAALACSLAMTTGGDSNFSSGNNRQITDTDPYKRLLPHSSAGLLPAAPDAPSATLAMSHIAE